MCCNFDESQNLAILICQEYVKVTNQGLPTKKKVYAHGQFSKESAIYFSLGIYWIRGYKFFERATKI